MNMFEIMRDYNTLIAQIEELGGEITPEIAEKLNINQKELEDKIKAYYYIIKLKEGEIAVIKDEQERLATHIKSKEGLIKRLKKVVDLALEEFGEIKPSGAKGLKFADLTVWQKKTEALQLMEDAVVDDERFCKKEVKFELTYQEAEFLLTLVEQFPTPIVKTIVNKTLLKEFVLDNESYLKELKNNASNITSIEEENIEVLKNTHIALVASIAHNSTPVFK